jgi:GntR family transcriptional repressor for pyruvate dehydrogenase complex
MFGVEFRRKVQKPMSEQVDETVAARPWRIAEELSLAIRSGSYGAGSRLPTEKMLCEQFGVSRTVVREAIARIKADGLVRSHQGSGLYVAETYDRRSFKVDDDFGNDIKRVLGFFELRDPIEMSAARFAAARRTDDDLARISAAHEAMIASGDWSDEGVSADLRFHHAIALATQNDFYADFMAFLGGVVRASIRIARAKSGQFKINAITIEEHAKVLHAIRDRDPEGAALAMHSHLLGARGRMNISKDI